MKEIIRELAEGNVGAETILTSLIASNYSEMVMVVLPKIRNCDLSGEEIFIFYTDICNESIKEMTKVCLTETDDHISYLLLSNL